MLNKTAQNNFNALSALNYIKPNIAKHSGGLTPPLSQISQLKVLTAPTPVLLNQPSKPMLTSPLTHAQSPRVDLGKLSSKELASKLKHREITQQQFVKNIGKHEVFVPGVYTDVGRFQHYSRRTQEGVLYLEAHYDKPVDQDSKKISVSDLLQRVPEQTGVVFNYGQEDEISVQPDQVKSVQEALKK